MKCGDCVHWRPANAREKRGYYLHLDMEPGICSKHFSRGRFAYRNNPVCKKRGGFKLQPVPVKGKCGDCEWFEADMGCSVDVHSALGRNGMCWCPLPKIARAVERMIWDTHESECPCWRAKNVKAKADK